MVLLLIVTSSYTSNLAASLSDISSLLIFYIIYILSILCILSASRRGMVVLLPNSDQQLHGQPGRLPHRRQAALHIFIIYF